MEGFVSGFGLYFAYFLFIVAALGALILPLINALGDTKKIVRGLIAIGVLGVLFLISWGISGGEITEMYTEKGVNATMSKVIGGAITMMYLLGGIAVIGIIYSEVHKAIK